MTSRRARVVVLLAALLGVGLTARLGWWQLDRAAEKSQLQARVDQRGVMPPLPAAQLARRSDQAIEQQHRRIVLLGRWLPEHTVYLENRQMNGRPGFFVVTPLVLAPGDAVLVQRGWMPRDFMERSRLQPLPTPEGEVSVQGRVAAWPSKLFDFSAGASASARGAIRQNVDMDELARATGLALRPLSIQQTDDAVGGSVTPADGLLRLWPVVNLDTSKHHGYAFQWFALSALIAGLYAWFEWIRPRYAKQQR